MRCEGGNAEVVQLPIPGTNDTHASVTDPDARLYKKSAGEVSRLAYLGHVLMDNRHGLIADY